MSQPRADFTATLLQNGKVLFAGGQTHSVMGPAYPTGTSSVDLFDPVTMTHARAAFMNASRTGHTATLLPSGKVLVAGGSSYPGAPSLASAEVYDPSKDQWTDVASMSSPRTHAAAVLLTNGKVLVAGGSGNSSNPPGAEIYDPAGNSWSSVQSTSGDTRPYAPTATLLQDGRVVILGGSDSGSEATAANVDIYDPSVGTIVLDRSHPMGGGRNGATATLLNDGTVIIVGGLRGTYPVGVGNTTDIYEPSKDNCSSADCSSFTVGPTTSVGHCIHTATLLKSGLLLVVGGQCAASDPIAVSELYDRVAMKWWPAAQPSEPRGHHAAVLLNDGRVLVAGGALPGQGLFSGNIEIYTPA